MEESALERIHREGSSHRERQRAHAVLLSSRNYGREVIADICGVSRDTVSLWMDRFERDGVDGLRDAAKSDRPSKLTVEAEQMLREALDNPIPGLKPLLLERLKKGTKRVVVYGQAASQTVGRFLSSHPTSSGPSRQCSSATCDDACFTKGMPVGFSRSLRLDVW